MTHKIISNVGNLKSYKTYTLPSARRIYGDHSKTSSLTKHQANIQELLGLLAVNGLLSTWEMAKLSKSGDLSHMRTREKEYRRLLMGRVDEGKKASGILDLGLVVKFLPQNNIRAKYRLSIHGLLYAVSVLDLSPKDYDSIAKSYSEILPHIFGKWDLLKSHIKKPEMTLAGIALGYSPENVYTLQNMELPINETSRYLEIKYAPFYETISEPDLADQLSYQYYTSILSEKNTESSIKTLQKIFSKDEELKIWYQKFIGDVLSFYEKKFNNLHTSIIKNI